jgi:D-alanyl-D-alanine carboxypeptidase (penicillin-binding protein 5/6)
MILLLTGGYSYWSLKRDFLIMPDTASISAETPAGTLAWPGRGETAVGILDSSVLETRGKQKPTPTASTAKLITSLVVLQKKPLQPGEQGPMITLGKSDVAIYDKYFAEGGSLVQIKEGEKISEYQMLEAILLPSANNMADSLAIWAFGSLKAYAAAANKYLESQGIKDTRVGGDASGFSPDTKSTASDLVKIGALAMDNPVLAKIVGEKSASGIPVAKTIKNRNLLLGTSNIVGIKTGNTDEAGGVFVSASRAKLNGKTVTIVTSLMGGRSLNEAMRDSLGLIRSAQANFKPVTVVAEGTQAGTYELPWGGQIKAVATKSLVLDTWAGNSIQAVNYLNDIKDGYKADEIVGSVTVPESALSGEVSVPVKLQSTVPGPTSWWKLTHPFD